MEGTNRGKRALLVAGGIVAALAIAVLVLVLSVDVNRYKPRIEAEASKVLGLTVRIRGNMDIGWFPPLTLSLGDLRVSRDGEDVLRAGRMRVGLKIVPLLRGRIRFRKLRLVRPEITIRRTSRGPFDFERYVFLPLRNAGNTLPGAFERIDEISVAGGRVSYVSEDSAYRAGAEDLDLAIRDVAFDGKPGEEPFPNVSFSGTVRVARATFGETEVGSVACRMTANNGNFEINPLTLTAFRGRGIGSAWASLAEATPMAYLHYSLSGFRVEEFFAVAGEAEGFPEGTGDLSVNLFFKGKVSSELIRTMSGDVSWTGTDLAVAGFDPDDLLPTEEGGAVLFARLGALLLPGPGFSAAARGLSASGARGESAGKEGRIGKLVSAWTVKNGVFEATDAAFATMDHRVVLTGKIDLPGERFEGVTVAVVDDRGCARSGRTIRGPFRLPRMTEALFAEEPPATREAPGGKTGGSVPAGECPLLYVGSVPPPK